MKILFISLGTRGDVEPLMAMAEILYNNGHEVSCAFSEQFRKWVEDTDMQFVSLGSEFIKVIESKTANKAFGGGHSGIRKLISLIKLAFMFLKIERNTIKYQFDAVKDTNPDLIVHSGIAIYPFIWELDHPEKTVLVSAAPYYLHYVREHPYVIFRKNFGPCINKLTYQAAIHGTVTSVKKAMKQLEIKKKISRSIILKLYNNPVYKENAEQIAFQMKEESSEQKLCDFITGEK